MTLAVIQELASQLTVLSVQRESAVQVHVNSRSMGPYAGVLVGLAILQSIVAEIHRSALLMCIKKMEHRVTTTRPTASLENVKPTMHSASITLEPVSNLKLTKFTFVVQTENQILQHQ